MRVFCKNISIVRLSMAYITTCATLSICAQLSILGFMTELAGIRESMQTTINHRIHIHLQTLCPLRVVVFSTQL